MRFICQGTFYNNKAPSGSTLRLSDAPGLMEQGGIQAQVPVVVVDQEPGQAKFGAGSAVDALILIKSLAEIPDIEAFCEVNSFQTVWF